MIRPLSSAPPKAIYLSYDILNKKLEDENMLSLYNDIEMPLSLVLGKMQYDGMYVDKNELVKLFQERDNLIALLKRTMLLESGYNLVEINENDNKRRGR